MLASSQPPSSLNGDAAVPWEPSQQQQLQNIAEMSYELFANNRDLVEKVQLLVSNNNNRLTIDIHELERIAPGRNLAQQILEKPLTVLPAYNEACRRLFESVRARSGVKAPLHPKLQPEPRLGLTGWLGTRTITPRGLTSRVVNKFVCVVGIVTKCSLVHPKLVRSFYCADKSLHVMSRTHVDRMALNGDAAAEEGGVTTTGSAAVPKTDPEGNPLRMEVGLSIFRAFQRATLQEMPETAPTGQLPRSVELVLEQDLVDKVKPGDRVRAWGVYRCVPHSEGDSKWINGFTTNCLLVCNVEPLCRSALNPSITPTDVRYIKELAQQEDHVLDNLARAVAPSLCGHDLVKRGLLLQQLGGERKVLPDGMHLRGDIHVLLVGDPSCGKSQMLRYMMNVAPLALSTTGRGSSGVGLTAAVSSDSDTGERKLEAGAMVLGDGGLVCIDEFDKMSHEDRVAIHEVLEQQTVSISKAGVQMTLNARTSVLAAANPVYGCFDPSVPLKSQVNFPDSLLTRFDLIYIIRDAQCEADDRRIASQVLQQLVQKAIPVTQEANAAAETGIVPMFALANEDAAEGDPNGKSSEPWTMCVATDENGVATVEKVISTDLLQKYLHMAKSRGCPVLSEEAVESIAEFYADLRQQCSAAPSGRGPRVVPTARTLEAAVRLATAHAKLRLGTTVTTKDAEKAQELLRFTLLGEVPEGFTGTGVRMLGRPAAASKITGAQKRRRKADGVEDDARGRAKKQQRQAAASSLTEEALVSRDSAFVAPTRTDDERSQQSVESQDSVELGKITQRRLSRLTTLLGEQQTAGGDSTPAEQMRTLINGKLQSRQQFDKDEFTAGLLQLQKANKIMLVDNEIWFI